MATNGHFTHNIFSQLDVSSLLGPAQVKKWNDSATSVLIRICNDRVLENPATSNILRLFSALNAVKGLQKLHLVIRGQNWRLNASVLAALVHEAPKLASLELSGAWIVVDSNDLEESLRNMPCLERATILDCRPFNPETTTLLPVIDSLSKNPNIRHLTLDTKALQGKGDAALTLASLGRSPSLNTLKLCKCNGHDVEEKAFLLLLQELHSNETMVELCIYDDSPANQLGIAIGTAVGDMLRANAKLRNLVLSLHPRDVPPVIDALRVNKTLKKLQLPAQHQSCGLEAVRHMLRTVLRHDNYVLEHCRFGGPSKCDIIEYFLTLNRLGRHFLLTNTTATQEDWVQSISSHDGRADVVLYFILKNPALISQVVNRVGRLAQGGSNLDHFCTQ